MKSYLVQIDSTNPKAWVSIHADTAQDAVFEAAKDSILGGKNPEFGYVALGESRHPNGAPLCVQSYALSVIRDRTTLDDGGTPQ